MKNLLIGGILALGLYGCGGDAPSSAAEDELEAILEVEETTTANNSLADSLIQTLNSIPSPIETAFQIQENGGEYNRNFLNKASNQDQYNTTTIQALNLGVYSADLAYINIYKSNDVLDYLGAVSRISEDLGIGEFFNLQAISQLVKHDDNLDSLLQVTTDNFEAINKYLQEQEQSHLSVLMLTGGWLEGLHLIQEVYNEKPSATLKERIGEQKIVLNQIVHLLAHYQDKNETISKLYRNLVNLNQVFSEVKIERIESDEVDYIFEDGIRIAVPKSSSQIIISDEQIKEIEMLVVETRKSVIG